MNKSRRSFLKVAGLSAFALSSGVAALSSTAQAAATMPGSSYKMGAAALKAKRWAMVIDTRAFKGPEDYQPLIDACHKAHNVPTIKGSNQNIKWFWLDKFDHAFPDDINAYQAAGIKERMFPLLCNHCTNPPCVRVCPTQATYQMHDGIVAMAAVFPALCQQLWDHYQAGQLDQARQVQKQLLQLRGLVRKVMPIMSHKKMLEMQGFHMGPPRFPFRALTLEEEAVVENGVRSILGDRL